MSPHYLINFMPKGGVYSETHTATGKVAAMDKAKHLAGDGAEFVKKGEGPIGYIGEAGAAYIADAS